MQRRKIFFKSILVILLGLMLSSCNNTLPPGEYDTNEVGKVKKLFQELLFLSALFIYEIRLA